MTLLSFTSTLPAPVTLSVCTRSVFPGPLAMLTAPSATLSVPVLNDAAVMSTLSRYDLEHIAAPTLVMSTADDLFGTFDGARYTAEHIAGARFMGYASGGHLWVGHHEEVLLQITTFLTTHESPHALSASPEQRNG